MRLRTARSGRAALASLLGALAAALSITVAAQEAPGGPSWRSLSPAQRHALQPLEPEWAAIDAARKQKWLEIASRFDRMSPDERARVQQRMSDWVRLSPKQRNEARQNYQGAKALSAEERQQRWQAYKELSDEQRRSLAAEGRGGEAPPREPRRSPPPASGKVNTVPNPLIEARPPRPVAPSVVQAKPGATTRPMGARPAPPLHQQTGLPKVATTPEFVDPATLLPQRGPQGAAAEPRRKHDKR